MILTDFSKKYSILTVDEARTRILENTPRFLKILKMYLGLLKLEKANVVGIGNSLTAGWSAVNSDVRPFVLKLGAILKDELAHSGIDLNFRNYSLASRNSNKAILDFIKSNPTEADVRERFISDKKYWDEIFVGTPFENYIDLEKAVDFYPNSSIAFLENYGKDSLSLSLVNGCTGGLLDDMQKHRINLKKSIDEELGYLQKIIEYLQAIKGNNSLITLGNFPYISTKVGIIVNGIITKINEGIQRLESEEVSYFDRNQIAFFQEFDNPVNNRRELKLDNHPTMDEQYTVLYYYFQHLINLLEENRDKIQR